MDAKLVTANFRLSQWQGIISDRTRSGLTVKEYCIEKNISLNAYYYWLRKLKAMAIDANPQAFAELLPIQDECITNTDTAFTPQMRITLNGVSIEFGSSTPRELLAMALEVSKYA